MLRLQKQFDRQADQVLKKLARDCKDLEALKQAHKEACELVNDVRINFIIEGLLIRDNKDMIKRFTLKILNKEDVWQ
jgi:hypothetical protein